MAAEMEPNHEVHAHPPQGQPISTVAVPVTPRSVRYAFAATPISHSGEQKSPFLPSTG
jgi:hypothetical protein